MNNWLLNWLSEDTSRETNTAHDNRYLHRGVSLLNQTHNIYFPAKFDFHANIHAEISV